MKKLILSVMFMGLFSLTTSAQEIGIRFGDVTGGKVAIDAVFSAGKYSRLHADVSFGDGVGVDLLWDFIYRPLGDDGLMWYLGVGPNAYLSDPFALGVVGEIGLEYRFKKAPIVIGADWRPNFILVETTDFVADSFGLNVRYVF
ncbi:hypothetical protein EV195_102193 [Tenacibaculum skagerrakense]|uniref:Outer membrane insertion C-signal n=1 Tax=Tenacibaculum skagerrakense TaxID=186571 RepID=A0A4R2NZ92_9FLAO|nr:outer membrane insertion C- signal [Tenacibaculum skagerrakense]TCP26851.1 hypothetical protein EV195_102193 [Tenacibaculum skagerrakense]